MSTLDSIEIEEWTQSLDAVLRTNGPEATSELLRQLSEHAEAARRTHGGGGIHHVVVRER